MPKLTPEEIQRLLSPKEGARTGTPTGELRIGTISDRTGAPAVNTVGFVFHNQELLITARARSSWLTDIRHDPRVCCLIDSDVYPLRKVTIHAQAEIRFEPGLDEEWREFRNPPTDPNYRPEVLPDGREEWSFVEAYSRLTWDEPRALVVIPLEGSRITSWRMPLEGESLNDVWASSYYDPEGDRPQFIVSTTDDGRGDVRAIRTADLEERA
jgi:Pyridoxamine 5'-phosphate oxidase